MATGDGPDGQVVSGNQGVSEGGTLRTNESDTTRGKFDSGQHRRGAREGNQGVSAFFVDRDGEPDRVGDAPDDIAANRVATGRVAERTPNYDRELRSNAQQTESSTKNRVGTRDQGIGNGENQKGTRDWGLGHGEKTLTPSPQPLFPWLPQPLTPNPPLIPDGVIFRVLSNLLILNGERLSYRSLDVEQIGSV